MEQGWGKGATVNNQAEQERFLRPAAPSAPRWDHAAPDGAAGRLERSCSETEARRNSECQTPSKFVS
jgi:hypothetical protein